MNNVRMMRCHTRTRTMGSIEVYDAKQEKWVTYVPDYNAWYQHFKDLRDGYVQPDHIVEEPRFKNVKNKHLGMPPF